MRGDEPGPPRSTNRRAPRPLLAGLLLFNSASTDLNDLARRIFSFRAALRHAGPAVGAAAGNPHTYRPSASVWKAHSRAHSKQLSFTSASAYVMLSNSIVHPSRDAPDWLSAPPCADLYWLSNKPVVRGLSHSFEGAFWTTNILMPTSLQPKRMAQKKVKPDGGRKIAGVRAGMISIWAI